MQDTILDLEGLAADAQSRHVLYDRAGDDYVVMGGYDRVDGLRMELKSTRLDHRNALALSPWAIREALPKLRARYPDADFVARLAALPCPRCGKLMDTAEHDFIHPTNREATRWTAACYEHNFGCGHAVFGDDRTHVTQKWNDCAPDDSELEAQSHVGPQQGRWFVVRPAEMTEAQGQVEGEGAGG